MTTAYCSCICLTESNADLAVYFQHGRTRHQQSRPVQYLYGLVGWIGRDVVPDVEAGTVRKERKVDEEDL